ncbi:MAG: N-carbamoylputrescine amidase [Puniceicoccaceae bacterium 5H]|nr:MAG: N-carbamoylputrescine amidase [Puniceicoccaceae bacterium 5H]
MTHSPAQVKVALPQYKVVADKQANLATAERLVRQAAQQGAQIICLQELFDTLYFCLDQNPDHFDLAEAIPGPATVALQALAKELEVVLVVPLFERRAPGLYHNSAAIIDADGELLGVYRKMHIPQDPGFEEKFYFTPGDLGFKAWDTRYGRIGVLICWDQWYPEGARLTALDGAQILFYPTAIGWLPEEKEALGEAQHTAWQTVQRGHAVANGCYVAAANRVGTEGNTEFWGKSFIADPYGQVMVEGGLDEEIVMATVDFGELENTRRWWPFFRDRRIDAYGDITQRWRQR